MGAVYQAWDQELAVAVALKVIRPDALAADPLAARDMERRFKRELLLARQVTHTNVVRIHDLGEFSGIKYISMPYVDGEDLATRLKREGKLPLTEALKIARQVAAGLAAANTAGIVHRDLKPANIMIGKDGQALIMDFGIARSAEQAAAIQPSFVAAPNHPRRVPTATIADGETVGATMAPGDDSATMMGDEGVTMAPPPRIQTGPAGGLGASLMQGAMIGTLEYMAPEQARGGDVDQRADIYAFGLIVTEMLLGRRAVPEGMSPLDALWKRIETPPVSLRATDASIPEAVDAIVLRCAQLDRSERFPTTADIVAALEKLDENGEPIPEPRRVSRRVMVAIGVAVIAMITGTYFLGRRAVPTVVQHDPVSVLIADFQNNTSDPAFDRTLEPMLKRALEGATFISAIDRNGIKGTLGVQPPEKLNETNARELAVKQALGVVLAGVLERQGSGYAVSVKAIQPVTGNTIASGTARAADKEQVVAAANKLAASVRTALGDQVSESDQIFAMTNLSSTSLEVVRLYAATQEAASNNKFEEARENALKAVQLDPNFGVGYQLIAVASKNVGRMQDAQSYISTALKYLDKMTEREKFTTRGFSNRMNGDYVQCVKEYGELVTRYPADVVGHNQVALCSSLLRDMKRAVEEMRQVVKLVPKRAAFRDNLALYSNYAGDFQSGEKEARTIQEPDAYALLALAFSQLGQGQSADAGDTYRQLAKVGTLGASFAASGLGDLATVEGRFAESARVLGEGAAQDLAAKNVDRAAAKFAAIAYAELQRGQRRAAIAASDAALRYSKIVKIRFLAARTYVEAGDIDKARPLMAGLGNELQAEPQAYAKIIEGAIALKNREARSAIKSLTEANTLFGTWIGHFDLGRAYLDAGAFTQADSEFESCIKRRGEALSLFLDEEPTYGYFPLVHYYLGRVREGLQSAGAADSYAAYLAIRGQSKEDPLVPDIRQRVGR
jgi:serine/threonine protein kinase/tetratricopeptide (TPR) repeat protein